ncbi:MAG: hypothetical protein HQK49_22055 [Oligoflexia bacterium]|nr:hypothetical protein [Oligoflexia bacterium]
MNTNKKLIIFFLNFIVTTITTTIIATITISDGYCKITAIKSLENILLYAK